MPTPNHRRLREFTERIGEGQFKPQRTFLFDALRGLFIGRNTMLSEWVRALREGRRFIHTEKRLSNNLKSKRFDDEALRQAVLRETSKLAQRHCDCISIDGTDIAKRYAKKMPHLAYVHDGSEDRIAPGWLVLRADGVAKNGRHVPVHVTTFSRDEPGFVDDKATFEDFLTTIYSRIPRSMPLVVDAGYDTAPYRKMFTDLGLRFTVRLKLGGTWGERAVQLAGASSPMMLTDLASSVPSQFSFRPRRFTSGRVEVGWESDVRFAPDVKKYAIVVIHRTSFKEPLVVLTNDRVENESDARAVADRYFNRWAIEDGHRLLKERFNLENLRVLTWRGIQRMVFLVHMCFAFMCWLVHRGDGEAIAAKALVVGKTPRNPYYRIAIALAFLLAT